MDTTKEVLQLAAQLDTIKLVLVVLMLGLIVLMIFLRNQTLTQAAMNERLAVRERAEAETRRMIVESQVKREGAQVGVVSQLASQIETLMDAHQQTLGLLAERDRISSVQTESIAVRNKIQEAQTAAIRANTVAVEEIAPAVVAGLTPVAEQFRKDVMVDAQAWVDGLKAEARGPLATIAGLPKRLETHEQRLEAIVERVPAEVAKVLSADLRAMSDHLRNLSEQIARIAIPVVPPPPREVALESTPQVERDTRAIADLRAELGKAEVDR